MSSDGPAPAAMPRLGSAFGQYRLDALVGRGGMGVVFRATDLRLERPVALKLISPELAADGAFRDRFVRESRLAAAIEHPAIVPIYEAGDVEGILYIAMRFVPGRDLGTVLRLEAPLGVERTLRIARRLADALDAAHRRGLVHRDVKPGNVLVEHADEELVYLADFGLSRRLGERTAPGGSGTLGTLDYVAPEQIEQGPLDGRADQYALACLVFHCLTGAPPFEAGTDAAVLYAHIQGERPRPSQRDPSLPETLDEPMMRALSRSPEDRFPDCRGFVAALAGESGAGAGADTGEPQRHEGASAPPGARKPAIRRGLRIVWLAGAAGLAIVMALIAPVILPPGPIAPDSSGAPTARRSSQPTPAIPAIASVGIGEVIVFASDVDGDYDLYALEAGRTEPRRLTRTSRQERSPAISPDGSTIAYVVGTEPTRDIWLMDADGRNPRRLTSHPADDIDPAWSADGQSLAFSSRRGDALYDIFEIRDRGTGLEERDARNLTSRPALETFPEWAPSGRRLAIASNHFGGNRNIVVIDADDRDVLLRRSSTFDFDFGPSWSPDGGSIAFYRRAFCRTCPADRGPADLWVMASRGVDPRRLTDTSARDEIDPDWSPDGRAIAFAAGRAGAMEIFLMTPGDRRIRQLTRGWANAVEPSWGLLAAAQTPSASPPPTGP